MQEADKAPIGRPKHPVRVRRRPGASSRANVSYLLATVAVVVDPAMFPQGGRVVLVMLKDGRQLEGELLVMTGRYAVGDVVFEAWEIETLEDVT